MGVEAKKNKLVAFLIKAALKERVGVLGSWGGWRRSKQAESFLYTHFLRSGHFGSGQQGEMMCLVYAILPQALSHAIILYMHTHENSLNTRAHTCAACTEYMHTCSHITYFCPDNRIHHRSFWNICTKSLITALIAYYFTLLTSVRK